MVLSYQSEVGCGTSLIIVIGEEVSYEKIGYGVCGNILTFRATHHFLKNTDCAT
jgi:hypothetical protein